MSNTIVAEGDGVVVEYDEAKRAKHTVNGEPVDSVTQILDILDKSGPLIWWAWRQGLKGVCMRLKEGKGIPRDPQRLEGALRGAKLTPYNIRDAAGARGNLAHDAAEAYAKDGTAPNPADFAEEDQGRVQALASWLLDTRPEFLETEVVVGSAEHHFCGKFDFIAKIDGQLVMGDYKTAKGIYPTMFLQLAAYELARREMGFEPTERQIVIRLGADGEYEQQDSVAEADWFLQVKQAHDAVKALKAAVKQAEVAA